jgi:hypothetical protein
VTRHFAAVLAELSQAGQVAQLPDGTCQVFVIDDPDTAAVLLAAVTVDRAASWTGVALAGTDHYGRGPAGQPILVTVAAHLPAYTNV